jgi:hypothetical protein
VWKNQLFFWQVQSEIILTKQARSSNNEVDPMPVNITPANIPMPENPINTTTIGRSNIAYNVLSESHN